jgi:hypothetical protein
MTKLQKYERTRDRRYSYTLPIFLEGIRLSRDFERLSRASARALRIYTERHRRR